jgi:hypothetical protein
MFITPCISFAKKAIPIGIPSNPEYNSRYGSIFGSKRSCCLDIKKNNNHGIATKPNPKPKAEVTNDAKKMLPIMSIVFTSP